MTYEDLTTEGFRKLNANNEFAKGFIYYLMEKQPELTQMMVDNHMKFDRQEDYKFCEPKYSMYVCNVCVFINQEPCKDQEVLPIMGRLIAKVGMTYLKKFLDMPEDSLGFQAQVHELLITYEHQQQIVFFKHSFNDCREDRVLLLDETYPKAREIPYTGTFNGDLEQLQRLTYNNGECLFQSIENNGPDSIGAPSQWVDSSRDDEPTGIYVGSNTSGVYIGG